MFLSSVTDRGATPALVSTLAFNQVRLKTIAENVANWQTPGYRAKQVDARGFQQALRSALGERGNDVRKPFVIRGDQIRTAADGRLQVTTSERPPDNVLFHDGTNLSIEREMAELAEAGMAQELTASLLRDKFDGLRKAIRGAT